MVECGLGECDLFAPLVELAPLKMRTPAGLRPVDRRGRRSAGEGARPTAPRVFFTFGGPQGHVALP